MISHAAFAPSSDSPAPEASALSQEENPRNQLMALMLLTAQPQVGLHSLSFLRPSLHYQTVAEAFSVILVFGAQSVPICKSQSI